MIEFRVPALIAPSAAVIGIIPEGDTILEAGEVTAGNQILEHPLAKADALTRLQTITEFAALRRAGSTLVLVSHDEALLAECADEIWWLRDSRIVARGHPAEILPLYRRHVAQQWRACGAGQQEPLTPTDRNGDGRAEITSIELLGHDGRPTSVWTSGEAAIVKVIAGFSATVADPVIGILIRTRVGLNVYGTNTELEQLHTGPVLSGESLTVTFRFQCELCPGDYTITAASHDPDGVWHDWQEDAVAFSVADTRYTAGVANLRAKVTAELTSNRPARSS